VLVGSVGVKRVRNIKAEFTLGNCLFQVQYDATCLNVCVYIINALTLCVSVNVDGFISQRPSYLIKLGPRLDCLSTEVVLQKDLPWHTGV